MQINKAFNTINHVTVCDIPNFGHMTARSFKTLMDSEWLDDNVSNCLSGLKIERKTVAGPKK